MGVGGHRPGGGNKRGQGIWPRLPIRHFRGACPDGTSPNQPLRQGGSRPGSAPIGSDFTLLFGHRGLLPNSVE